MSKAISDITLNDGTRIIVEQDPPWCVDHFVAGRQVGCELCELPIIRRRVIPPPAQNVGTPYTWLGTPHRNAKQDGGSQ